MAWTKGKRFVYFPGTSGRFQSINPSDSLDGESIDHITLELNETTSRFSEHVAVLGHTVAKTHGTLRTGRVHQGQLHPWFSLLLPDLDRYEKLPAHFRFDMLMPKSDSGRRTLAMMDRPHLHATYFPIPASEGPHYFQLDVWAGRGEDWKEKSAAGLEYRNICNMVSEHSKESFDMTVFTHDFLDDCGIVVLLTRPSGVLLTAGLACPTTLPIETGDMRINACLVLEEASRAK